MITRIQLRALERKLIPEGDDEIILYWPTEDGGAICHKYNKIYTAKEWAEYKEKCKVEGEPVLNLDWEEQ